jgi:hypothetical protein
MSMGCVDISTPRGRFDREVVAVGVGPAAGDLIHGTFRYLQHTNAANAEKA